mgnify:FL=1
MNNTKLVEMLKFVESVQTNKWKYVLKIVDIMYSIRIISKLWGDSYKNNNPDSYHLNLHDIKTWSTFNSQYNISNTDCINLKFRINNDNLYCDVCIYNVDRVNGYRESLRFTAILEIPISFIQEIETFILEELDIKAKEAFILSEMNREKRWISEYKDKILNS